MYIYIYHSDIKVYEQTKLKEKKKRERKAHFALKAVRSCCF